MPTRVAVGDNKYCYTGPTCHIHSAHWSQTAEEKLNAARKKLKATETYEDFAAVRAEVDAAQAEYDRTSEGYSKLAMRKNFEYTDELRARFAQVKADHVAAENLAIQHFLSSTTPEQRAAEMSHTDDKEKIDLCMGDTNEAVQASLALNPHVKARYLVQLSKVDSEQVQMNVARNPSTHKVILLRLSREGKTNAVKELAKARLNTLAE